jgi:hypothetical protein
LHEFKEEAKAVTKDSETPCKLIDPIPNANNRNEWNSSKNEHSESNTSGVFIPQVINEKG